MVAETDNPYRNYVSVRVLNCMGEMVPKGTHQISGRGGDSDGPIYLIYCEYKIPFEKHSWSCK